MVSCKHFPCQTCLPLECHSVLQRVRRIATPEARESLARQVNSRRTVSKSNATKILSLDGSYSASNAIKSSTSEAYHPVAISACRAGTLQTRNHHDRLDSGPHITYLSGCLFVGTYAVPTYCSCSDLSGVPKTGSNFEDQLCLKRFYLLVPFLGFPLFSMHSRLIPSQQNMWVFPTTNRKGKQLQLSPTGSFLMFYKNGPATWFSNFIKSTINVLKIHD